MEGGAVNFFPSYLFCVVNRSLRKDGESALPVTLLKDARLGVLVRARNPGGADRPVQRMLSLGDGEN